METLSSSYIDALPGGLDAFPECLSRRSVWRDVLARLEGHPLDRRLQRAIELHVDEWWPSTVGSALNLALVEVAGDEREALSFVYEANRAVYRRPLFRALMMVMSPSLAFMGAARRWHSFHRGTRLQAESSFVQGDRRVAHLGLEHPGGLYTPTLHRMFGESFRAATVTTGIDRRDVVVEVDSRTGGASFAVSWPA